MKSTPESYADFKAKLSKKMKSLKTKTENSLKEIEKAGENVKSFNSML